MTTILLVCAVALALALFLFGWAVVRAADLADQRDQELRHLLLAQQFSEELSEEADRWR